MTASTYAHDLLNIASAAADAKQADDLVAFDVSDSLPFSDVFLLATGRNERNVIAIADEIEDRLALIGVKAIHREGRAEGHWILLDFGDLIVHVFREEDRLYYSLERLWKDCPAIPVAVPVGSGGE